MMLLPVVIGLALGSALVTTFSARNRGLAPFRRSLMFVRNFSLALIAVLGVNFVIFATYYR